MRDIMLAPMGRVVENNNGVCVGALFMFSVALKD